MQIHDIYIGFMGGMSMLHWLKKLRELIIEKIILQCP